MGSNMLIRLAILLVGAPSGLILSYFVVQWVYPVPLSVYDSPSSNLTNIISAGLEDIASEGYANFGVGSFSIREGKEVDIDDIVKGLSSRGVNLQGANVLFYCTSESICEPGNPIILDKSRKRIIADSYVRGYVVMCRDPPKGNGLTRDLQKGKGVCIAISDSYEEVSNCTIIMNACNIR